MSFQDSDFTKEQQREDLTAPGQIRSYLNRGTSIAAMEERINTLFVIPSSPSQKDWPSSLYYLLTQDDVVPALADNGPDGAKLALQYIQMIEKSIPGSCAELLRGHATLLAQKGAAKDIANWIMTMPSDTQETILQIPGLRGTILRSDEFGDGDNTLPGIFAEAAAPSPASSTPPSSLTKPPTPK